MRIFALPRWAVCSSPAVVAPAMLAVATLALAAAGCRPAAPPEPASGPPLAPGANLVLISIDTLRADRLGSYGYPRPTSPALDALAAGGVRFASVVAESSWTLPSHLTLFTGLAPTSHGVTLEDQHLPPGIPTLGETLRQAGYRTFAYTSGGLLGGEYGFARGFEVYHDKYKRLRRSLDMARAQIEALEPEEPYFIFIHTYDVHCPYDPPEEVARAFRTRPPEDHLEVAGRCGSTHYNHMSLTPGQVAFLSDQYDAGIRAADDDLAAFFGFLEQRGEWADTVVAVVSDHGEELQEHGSIGHERTLYIESLRVPWIMAGAGLEARVVEPLTGLKDVAPTLLDVLGLPPMAGVQGRSLVPLMRGGSQQADEGRGQQPVFSELDRHVRLRSMVDGRHHYIADLTVGRRHLFDLAADPGEGRDLLAAGEPAPQGGLPAPRADWGRRLGRALVEHFRGLPRPPAVPSQRLSPEMIEELRALGYVD